jgi:putative peptidoglycan lipid II flippase
MKQAVQLGTLSALNIGLTFLFQWYALTVLGPGVETDAFFAGMTIPQLVLVVISGSLLHVIVPLLAGEPEDRLHHDAWALLSLVGGLFSILAIVLFALAPWWVPLTVPGFDSVGQALTVELTRIQLIGMVFAALNGVQLATYHARQRFVWAEFTPILSNALALLLLIWALPRFGVIAAAWISVLRMALQTMLLAPSMGKPCRLDLRSNSIRQAWQRIKPLLLGTTYYKTDPMVDRYLLSTASSGSLSLYFIAQQIYGAVNHIFNKAIVSPLIPTLSRLNKRGDKKEFRRIYYLRLVQIGFIAIIGLIFLVLFGQAVLGILIGHGNVNDSNIKELWLIMIWLGGMFFGGAMGQITSSTFYACNDTVTPTRISIITYTLYIPCKVTAFYLLGVFGLAIITSIYFIINLSIQIYLLERKLIS